MALLGGRVQVPSGMETAPHGHMRGAVLCG
jgi:hypothetical protein